MFFPFIISILVWVAAFFWPRSKKINTSNGISAGIEALLSGTGMLIRFGLALIVTLIVWLIYFIAN